MFTPEQIEELTQQKVKEGRIYPLALIETAKLTLLQALEEWLKDYGLPEQIFEACDNLIMLERTAREKEHLSLNDWDARWLAESMPLIWQLISDLGGEFEGGGSISQGERVIAFSPQNHPPQIAHPNVN